MRNGERRLYPFHSVNIDHKGPLNPISDRKHSCLVVDAFSSFIQVYPFELTDFTQTVEAMTTFRISFGLHQKLVYDKGTSSMSADFSTFLL